MASLISSTMMEHMRRMELDQNICDREVELRFPNTLKDWGLDNQTAPKPSDFDPEATLLLLLEENDI